MTPQDCYTHKGRVWIAFHCLSHHGQCLIGMFNNWLDCQGAITNMLSAISKAEPSIHTAFKTLHFPITSLTQCNNWYNILDLLNASTLTLSPFQ
eukprot:9233300-Ditylum_brightwellii.AAC.2